MNGEQHTDSLLKICETIEKRLKIFCILIASEPRQPGGCKLKTAPVRPVVAARPAEYVCSEDLFY
ncbi:hypothetical protein B5B05_23795 [Salmonella enterica subsp. enterica serovar Typhimurium]|nr:hypothetical protein [Salmonella enterica subsp. enterica serovar Typhimurium]